MPQTSSPSLLATAALWTAALWGNSEATAQQGPFSFAPYAGQQVSYAVTDTALG